MLSHEECYSPAVKKRKGVPSTAFAETPTKKLKSAALPGSGEAFMTQHVNTCQSALCIDVVGLVCSLHCLAVVSSLLL